MSLGNNIKKYRRDLGMTQEELAGILCITGQAVSKWESGAGLPDVTQIVPLAQALNVSTDALFGFNAESYDKEYAEQVKLEADQLRDNGDPAQGALASAEYLDKKCEENIFNYRIMMRYVQAIAHMSRFVNPENTYYRELMADDQKGWKHMVRLAENRAMQVIRYSEEKELADYCHYALAWIYWHTQEYEKGRQHVDALPTIRSNMLQETLLPYYISATTDRGIEGWKEQVRDNFQNFVRAINKQILYAAEGMMWSCPLGEVEVYCRWGITLMEHFMADDRLQAYCQGFYRDTCKFLIAAYLRNDEPEKAAEEWKRLMGKIDEYVAFCSKVCKADREAIEAEYGKKAADNMSHYTREYIDGKMQFMRNQLKGWCGEEVFAKFEKMI